MIFFLQRLGEYLAQLVEQLAYNEKVSGSSPLLPNTFGTYKKYVIVYVCNMYFLFTHCGGCQNYADVVELVDTPDLGSGDVLSCGFKSCHP